VDKRDQLIKQCAGFLEEIQGMTAGTEMEQWLNRKYGPDSTLYNQLAGLIKTGVEEGWAADIEIGGAHYRRGRLAEPTAQTCNFSIAAVYIDSESNPSVAAGKIFRGDYHEHPHGEVNLVVPLDEGAVLAGPNGWCGPGWTAPAPGSRHYPEVKGGALIALFFLPAGSIAYVEPPVRNEVRA